MTCSNLWIKPSTPGFTNQASDHSRHLPGWCENAQDPALLARQLSLALSKRTTKNRFITAFLALLDSKASTLTFTNVGHNPILVLRVDGTRELLPSQGFPLALFPGKENGQATLHMEPGDLVFMYTDGITEAVSPEGLEFDLDAIANVLQSLGPLPLEELHRELNEALCRHTQGAALADDRTIVMVRRKN